jgi:uncharacterized protein YjbI with pentapeptide repeats
MTVNGEQVPAPTPNGHHSDPCQHAYANVRARIFDALTQPRRSRLSKGAQSSARAALLFLDVPARWLMNLSDTVIGNRGYFTVGSVLAVYLAVFGLIDAKSTQEETHASLERSVFMTLVSSGNAASFVAAMKDFGPTQTMAVTEHPSWLKFWEWGRTYRPNREPMWHWAAARLDLCKKELKDCSVRGDTRIDIVGAKMSGALLAEANLTDADLSEADLTGANLTGAKLLRAQLWGAKLSGAHLSEAFLFYANLKSAQLGGAYLRGTHLDDAVLDGADLGGANLHGADLTQAVLRGAWLIGAEDLTQVQLDRACGDENTKLDPPLKIKPCQAPPPPPKD